MRPHERIPLHGHTGPNDGGRLTGSAVVTVVGGSDPSTGTGSVTAGTYELAIEGGQSVIKVHGSMGATETFDPTDGNVHTGTLDADCTFTLNTPAGSGACALELWLSQDGTGGHVITWPGSVTVDGTLDTTASTTSRVILETIDGGTSWVASVVGGGASALDDLTDVTITAVADGDVLTYDAGTSQWVNAAPAAASGHYEILMASGSADPLLTSDGLDYLYVWVTD